MSGPVPEGDAPNVSKAERTMEANNLLIAQVCVNMLEGRKAFDGLETGLTQGGLE